MPSKAVTIDQWFANQDKAVDVVHRRMKRSRKPIAVQPEEPRPAVSLTDNLIDTFEKIFARRKELEEDGEPVEWLESLASEVNTLAFTALFTGALDSAKHQIQVTHKMVAGKSVHSVVIDGRCVL